MSYNLQVANGENNLFNQVITTSFTRATYEMEMIRGSFTDYSAFMRGQGRVVQVPVAPGVTVSDHTDGTTVASQNPSFSEKSITTNIKATSIPLTDYIDITVNIQLAQWAGTELGRAYMQEFEKVLAASFNNFDSDSALVPGNASNQVFNNTVANPDVKGLVSSARTNHRRGNVPGNIYGVLPVDVMDSLQDQLTTLSSGDITNIGNRVLETGETMNTGGFRLFGVTLKDSTVLPTPTVGDLDETGAFYSSMAIGYAEKKSPTLEIWREGLKITNHIILHGMYGANVIDNRYGYKVNFRLATS